MIHATHTSFLSGYEDIWVKGLKSTHERIIKITVLSYFVNNLPNPKQVSKSINVAAKPPAALLFFPLPSTNDTQMHTLM